MIIHGLNQSFLAGGEIDVFFDEVKVGSVGKKDTAEFLYEKDTKLVLKCGINPLKGHVELQNGMQTEIQCVYNRVTGAIQAQVLTAAPYQGSGEGPIETRPTERPVYVLDGGQEHFLCVYEDRVAMLIRDANSVKTIYYSDITLSQYKEIMSEYIRSSRNVKQADRAAAFLNRKIREAKAGVPA